MATIIQRGTKWRAQVRREGQSLSGTFETKSEAKVWATQQEAHWAQTSADHGVDMSHTLDEAMERYLVEVSPTKKGERWEVIRLTALRSDRLAAVPFSRLSATHLAQWRDQRLLQVSPATVNRELNLLSAVLTRAKQEWRWASSNPISEIKRPTNPPPRDRRISPDEQQKVVAALGYRGGVAMSKQQEVAVLFLLALETAMRKGELLGLRWEDVAERSLMLRETKNGSRRQVPLSSRAVELLGALSRERERCFSVAQESADTLFRRACRQAEVEGLHFHDTRHEAITRLAAKLTVLELARMVGHRDLKSLMIYYNATPAELADKLG